MKVHSTLSNQFKSTSVLIDNNVHMFKSNVFVN